MDWKKLRESPLFWTIFFAGLAFLLLVLDFATKWIVQANLKEEGTSICLIPNFLYITLAYNTGAAFSLGSGTVGGRIFNIAISIIMSVLFIGYYVISYKKSGKFLKSILALLIAGALGNLIDRCFYWKATTGFDGVIDWIQFYLGGGPNASTSIINPFATFNIADACLVIGVILFIVYLILDSVKTSKEKQAAENEPNVVPSDPSMHKDNGEGKDE